MKSKLETAMTITAASLSAMSVWYFLFDMSWPWTVGETITLVIAAAVGAFVVDLVRGR